MAINIMDSETKLLLALTFACIVILIFIDNYDKPAPLPKDMNLSERIHEINKMGIPYEKDCE